MQTIRERVSAALNLERNRFKSIRDRIACGEADYAAEAERCRLKASSGTIRKWRRTHEAREAGWLK